MSNLTTYHIYPLSERAAVIDLGNIINEQLNNKVLAMQSWLKQHAFAGLKDIVAAYSSLMVLYEPSISFEAVRSKLEQAWTNSGEAAPVGSKIISLPVCYDPVFGFDIEEMAAEKNLNVPELVNLHCSVDYRVYMLGFLPGFAYMGSVDERLVMPRKPQPREVPAGSVGIAGLQTGIYPFASPGGWQIIGRTPIKLFDAEREEPVLLTAGDTVRFYSISIEEYGALHH